MYESPQPTKAPRRARALVAVTVVIILLVATGIYIYFFVAQAPSPGTVQFTETEAVSVPEGMSSYKNEANDYTLTIPQDWKIFEEEHHPERAQLLASEMRDLLSSCGISCTVLQTVKLGNYPGIECTSDACASLERTEGTALTIYTFGNPGSLNLSDFLAQALLKNADSDNFSRFETINGLDILNEVLRFKDGRRLHNYYLAKDDLIYWLAGDISETGLQEHSDLLGALDGIISLLTFQ